MAIKRFMDDTPVDNDNCVVVATKISKSFFKQLMHICRCKGLSIYTFIQMATETIVRYCDDRHNLTPEMEKAMMVFEHLDGWSNAYNLADPTKHEIQVEQAVYFVSKEGRKGMRTMLIAKPYLGEWEQTFNPQEIIEKTVAVTAPELYRRMRRIGADMETSSLMETMMILVDMHSDEDELREMRKMFEDNNRSEFGVKPHEGAPYRRKMHKTVDSVELPIPFDVEP